MAEDQDERTATTGGNADAALDAALEAAATGTVRTPAIPPRSVRQTNVFVDDEDVAMPSETAAGQRPEPKPRAKKTAVKRAGAHRPILPAEVRTGVADKAVEATSTQTETASAAADEAGENLEKRALRQPPASPRSTVVSKLVVGATFAASIAALAVVLLTRFEGADTQQAACDAAITEIRSIIADNPDRTGISREVLDQVLSAQATSHVNCLFKDVVAIEQSELMPWLGLIPPQTSAPATSTPGG